MAFSDDFEYREFFDDCGCFFFALDRQTRFIEVDRQGARATGYSRREILKKALSDIVPPEHRDAAMRLLQLDTTSRRVCVTALELLRKDGSRTPVCFFARAERQRGKPFRLRIMAIPMELHELERYERALRLTQFSVEHASESIFWVDPEGRLVYANRALCQALGYSRDELASLHIWDIAPRRSPETWPARWREMKGARSLTFEGYHRSRSGEVFPVEVSTNYVTLGGEEYLFCFARDIRERRRTENALSQLSGRLLQTQDQEQRRIARELHDAIGQSLATLQITLGLVERSGKKLGAGARQALEESIALAKACATEVRTLSYLLHPPLLDELGLLSALRNYVEGYAQRTRVRLDLKLPKLMERLPQDVEIALFRIVQEGLTNIHRHSGSRRAMLRLTTKPGWIMLELIDHGRGMPGEMLKSTERMPARIGVGIGGMRERARQLGGQLLIASGPGGTTLRVELPLDPRTRAAH